MTDPIAQTPFKRLSYLVTEDGTKVAVKPLLIYSNPGAIYGTEFMIGIMLSPGAFKELINDDDSDLKL